MVILSCFLEPQIWNPIQMVTGGVSPGLSNADEFIS